MKFAYADPPYLGMAKFYDHPESAVYDTLQGHAELFVRLEAEFPDGWAYSLSTPTLRQILPLAPGRVRVAAWVKPFASFKPGVNPAYAWEPVIFAGGRKRTRKESTVRDFVSCNIALKKGFFGAKPEGFCFWLFDLLGMTPDDEFVDIFPGSGAVGRAWDKYRRLADGMFYTPEIPALNGNS
jgi:hypothetical protein